MDEWTDGRNTQHESRITIRHFAWDDAPALVDLTNAATAADGIDRQMSVQEFRREFGGPLSRPERDILMARYDGQIVAVALAWMEGRENEPHPIMPLLLHIHPDCRDHNVRRTLPGGVGARLVDMALAQGRDLGAAVATSPVRHQEPYKRDLLLARGFAYARSWWRLRAGLTEGSRIGELPAGFHARAYQGHQDDAPLVRLVNDIFSTEYLDRTYTEAEICHWAADRDFDPGLLKLVVGEPDGTFVGYVWGWIDADSDERAGFIGDLGVREAYRGRGLGRWLLQRCKADLRERGMDWADLDVDGTNDQARRLYESEGFQVREEVHWYEKRIRESTNPRMDE